MEEKEILAMGEQQHEEKKPVSKFYDYLFAFFFGVFVGAALLYWVLSPRIMEICNTGLK